MSRSAFMSRAAFSSFPQMRFLAPESSKDLTKALSSGSPKWIQPGSGLMPFSSRASL